MRNTDCGTVTIETINHGKKIFYIMGKSASGKDNIYSSGRTQRTESKNTGLYTTRPIRAGEQDGKNYYFVDDAKLEEFRKNGNLIEARAYHTVHGIWTYFTADDGQVDLKESDYLGIGTLESFTKMRNYYGEDAVCPVYIQVEDGERLARALKREREQTNPKYEEMCRRFLADQSDFSGEYSGSRNRKRFQNVDLEVCVKEIVNYIKSVQ